MTEAGGADTGATPVRLLIVGQLPPPYIGQAIMIKHLLDEPMLGVERHHVRLGYSRETEEVGRLRFRKLAQLASVLVRTLSAIARIRPDVVLYPPAGPMWVPVLRDIVTLVAVRPFIRRLVFHFHATGVSELWKKGISPRPFAWLFRRAYFGADLAIMVTQAGPDDGGVLQARRSVYIRNGVRAAGFAPRIRSPHRFPLRVLFAGMVTESKGALILVEAAKRLWSQNLDFDLQFMGSCDAEMREKLELSAGPYLHRLELLGTRTGDSKWEAYAEADVFSLPTHFAAEGSPAVCLEGMMFDLPVVATRWRGIPEMVVHEETGLLVPPKDAEELAYALRRLILDGQLRVAMGARGRRRYEELFTLERHVAAVRHELLRVART